MKILSAVGDCCFSFYCWWLLLSSFHIKFMQVTALFQVVSCSICIKIKF